jgi:hypothetical protein
MSAVARSSRPWLSPLGTWARVGAAEVQEALRRAFARRGMPVRMRVDDGTPWGATGGLPTAPALWLIGPGVGMIWNPPRSPRRNGVVGRSQDVGQDWAEPWTCADAAELQARLDEVDRIQRDEYPAIGGLSRRAAYPGLSHSGRAYSRRREAGARDLERVTHWLSGVVVQRRVDVNGKVSIYDRCHWVGRRHEGRTVWVTLDPDTTEWVIMAEGGGVLKRVAAAELTAERICRLAVSRERAPRADGKT